MRLKFYCNSYICTRVCGRKRAFFIEFILATSVASENDNINTVNFKTVLLLFNKTFI